MGQYGSYLYQCKQEKNPYFKAERKRFYTFEGSNICFCCGDLVWDIVEDEETLKEKKIYDNWKNYIQQIKTILNKRENDN